MRVPVSGAQPDLVGDATAQHAGSHRVAGWLTLGQVERVREGSEDLREPETSVGLVVSKLHPGSIGRRRLLGE